MTKKILIFFAVICLSFCILDEQDRYCLVNSLAIGGDNDKIMNWDCKNCNKSYEPTPLDNTPKNIRIVQGYAQEWLKKNFTQDFKAIITLYDNFIILAFKFTDNIPKLFVDLNAISKRIDTAYKGCDYPCKVHQGFYKLWNKNKEKVYQSLKEIYNIKNVKKLYITGISLGGALAVMSFFDIKNKFPQFTDIQVTTFGAPRVGNKKFAQCFDKWTNNSSKRFVVKKDPVPSLPPKLLGAYQHTGVQYLCDVQNQNCQYLGHVNTDFSNQTQNDLDFLKTFNNPSMFNINICKSEKHSHNFLRKRVFQHQLQKQNHENQLSQSHQIQKHDGIKNHICDYPKLLYFAKKDTNYTNDNLNVADSAGISNDNNVTFGSLYRKMLAHSLITFYNNDSIQNWKFDYSNECDPPSNLNNIPNFQNNKTGFKAIITTYLNQRSDDNHMVLSFRGSNNPENWESDRDKEFTDYQNCNMSNCKVHQGFYKLWKTACTQIIGNLTQIKKNKNISKLYLTGISLGGALAQISVIDILKQINFTSISVVTFGSPRVGNKVWGQKYNNLQNMTKTQRFTLKGDPVPIIPAWPHKNNSTLQKEQQQQYFQIGIQNKCEQNKQKQLYCSSKPQGDNNQTITDVQYAQLEGQILLIQEMIRKQCGGQLKIYCAPYNLKYPLCLKLNPPSYIQYNFNVHACNYPKLFTLPKN